MRRALTLVIPALVLAACGSSGNSASSTSTADTTVSTEVSDTSTLESTDSTFADTTVPLDITEPTRPPLSSVALPADCPNRTPPTTVPAAPDPVEKPEIELPDPIPTELKVTTLTEGSGRAAEVGDQVLVYYIGVLSKDGSEFDSNFGTGQPFEVVVGTSPVIDGWSEGLVGVKAGQRVQLDIPSELGYGADGYGDAIGPDEPLTFIIDVASVGSAPPEGLAADPADQPDYTFEAVTGPAEFATDDLVEGDECEVAQPGDTVFVNAITVRGDTLEELDNTWQLGQAYPVVLDGETVWGFAQGIVGMGVGGQRLVTIPPADGFGEENNVAQGLEPDTVLLVLLELEGIVGVTEFDDPATATTAPLSDAESSTTDAGASEPTEAATTTAP